VGKEDCEGFGDGAKGDGEGWGWLTCGPESLVHLRVVLL
jgi:hypothetical protein